MPDEIPSADDDRRDPATCEEVLAVFEAHRALWRRWFAFKTRSLDVADELLARMADKILGIHKGDAPVKLPNYPKQGDELNWLLGMRERVRKDWFRRRNSAPTAVNINDFVEVIAGREPSPQELVDRNELRRAISASLLRLDSLERLVVTLRVLDGLSVADVRDFVNPSQDERLNDYQVRKIKERGLRRLRESMAKYGYRFPSEAPDDPGSHSGRTPDPFLSEDIVNVAAVAEAMGKDAGEKLRRWLEELPRWVAAGRDACAFSKEDLAEIFNEISQKSFSDTFCVYDEKTWPTIDIPARAQELAKVQADELKPRQRVLLNRFLIARLLEPGIDRTRWEERNVKHLETELGLTT